MPLQAYASFVDAAPSDVLLASLKAGATEKFNGDLSNNWERLQCTPTDAAPRVVCKNQFSSDYAIVFDADCGAAGPATIEVGARVGLGSRCLRHAGGVAMRAVQLPCKLVQICCGGLCVCNALLTCTPRHPPRRLRPVSAPMAAL